MTLSIRLRRSLVFAPLLILLGSVPGRCVTAYRVTDVTRERAKELGIAVHTQPAPDHALQVQVEFKAAGPLKAVDWANLELTQGGKRLVTADLTPRSPAVNSTPESRLLQFYIDPAALPDAYVTILARDEKGGVGYRLRMKDYVGR